MKIALHLSDLDYINDYIDMGVSLFIAGGAYSAYSTLKLTDQQVEALKNTLNDLPLYIMVNGLYDEHELEPLFVHIDHLAKIKINGLLFQDFAVLQYVKEKGYEFDMMYAPMALNTNPLTLETLKALGISSAWLAKEIPLKEQMDIKSHVSMPVMIQGHGVQYMASSKRKLLENYREASHLSFSSDTAHLTIQPQGQDFLCHIYEDERGTTVYSANKLYMLDLMNDIHIFDYLLIETMFMSASEAIEVTSIYCDCLQAYEKGEYDHVVKEYLPMLRNISKPLDRGFIEDATIYRLEDVKRRDLDENNQ